ncbi:MAG: nicotinate phosphoribosyltransferase [Candidatus Acidiferrales bacterium]
MIPSFARESSGLLTDLYELTMAAGYFQNGFEAHATFELFVRELPPERNFLVAAGLEQALDFLESVRFAPDEIDYLRRDPLFRHVRGEFFDYLSQFRFTGEVWAVPEGSVVFANEPILRVTAPIIEAQLAETRLLSGVNFQTMVASRAARLVAAAGGKPVVEFGARRAHGAEAGIFAARAAWIAGCAGTSNVIAARTFGIPAYGTQAHSWIMAYEDEAQAFARFLDVFPEQATLLLDTYNVRAALRKIIAAGRKPAGVRLDSGDMAADSLWVRAQLDRAGWQDVQIFASGDLDEKRISALIRRDAKIDAFGVGSALVAPTDARNLSMIYKVVELEHAGKTREAVKLSEAKATFPGRKQVFRFADSRGKWKRDLIALDSEVHRGTEVLLVPVMCAGKRIAPAEPLSAARQRCAESLKRLPSRLLSTGPATPYPVQHSKPLRMLLQQVRRRIRQRT